MAKKSVAKKSVSEEFLGKEPVGKSIWLNSLWAKSRWVKNLSGKIRVDGMLAFVPPSQVILFTYVDPCLGSFLILGWVTMWYAYCVANWIDLDCLDPVFFCVSHYHRVGFWRSCGVSPPNLFASDPSWSS